MSHKNHRLELQESLASCPVIADINPPRIGLALQWMDLLARCINSALWEQGSGSCASRAAKLPNSHSGVLIDFSCSVRGLDASFEEGALPF